MFENNILKLNVSYENITKIGSEKRDVTNFDDAVTPKKVNIHE